MTLKTRFWIGLSLCLAIPASFAQEATLRKNFAELLPYVKSVDEVNKTAVQGLYEVRINGTDIVYSNAEGTFLFEGRLLDLKAKRNLTDERVTKLVAIKTKELSHKDAFTIVRGNGQRKLVVFEDPNCGYCKRFEKDLQGIDNITVYLYLYPILGPDSTAKSKAIWCAKDPAQAWQDWMIRNIPLPAASEDCDSTALTRNTELGRKHKVTGTPTLLFADDQRVPGAIDAKRIEKILADIKG